MSKATSPQQAPLVPIDLPVSVVPLSLEPHPTDFLSMFERLARDAAVDVDKLERLMQMHERAQARMAEEAFNGAMSTAQKGMRQISTDAQNPQTQSRYASYSKLDKALRPIYTEHGFALSFNTGDGGPENYVRVLCYVTHASGFARTYHVDMPADGKGAKGNDVMTRTHATGAALSYGMRYLLKMIFNVAVGEDDTDGNAPGNTGVPPPPKGYEDWWKDMQAVADNGRVALKAAWEASRADYRVWTGKHAVEAWEALKAKAKQVAVPEPTL